MPPAPFVVFVFVCVCVCVIFCCYAVFFLHFVRKKLNNLAALAKPNEAGKPGMRGGGVAAETGTAGGRVYMCVCCT